MTTALLALAVIIVFAGLASRYAGRAKRKRSRGDAGDGDAGGSSTAYDDTSNCGDGSGDGSGGGDGGGD